MTGNPGDPIEHMEVKELSADSIQIAHPSPEPEDRRLMWGALVLVTLLLIASTAGSVFSVIRESQLRQCLIRSNDAAVARQTYTDQFDDLTRRQNAVIIASATGTIKRDVAIKQFTEIQREREELQDKRNRFRSTPARDCG